MRMVKFRYGRSHHFCLGLLFSILFTMVPGSRLEAQNELGEKVDKIINKAMAQEGFPGIVVAVIQDNKILFQNAYGVKPRKSLNLWNKFLSKSHENEGSGIGFHQAYACQEGERLHKLTVD